MGKSVGHCASVRVRGLLGHFRPRTRSTGPFGSPWCARRSTPAPRARISQIAPMPRSAHFSTGREHDRRRTSRPFAGASRVESAGPGAWRTRDGVRAVDLRRPREDAAIATRKSPRAHKGGARSTSDESEVRPESRLEDRVHASFPRYSPATAKLRAGSALTATFPSRMRDRPEARGAKRECQPDGSTGTGMRGQGARRRKSARPRLPGHGGRVPLR